MRIFIVLVTIIVLAPRTALLAQQINVLDAGSRSQLLLDPSLVFDAERVSFSLHPGRKHPQNPLMVADKPWEGGYVSMFAGTVMFDQSDSLFKMWYTCENNPEYFAERGICYATSRDGLTWEKPAAGTRKARNGKPHNSVLALGDCPSVFRDEGDPDPARRYKMIAFDVNRGYMAYVSPDGLNWKEQSAKPVVPISYVDDVVSAFHDRAAGEFGLLGKLSTPVFGRVRRSIYLATSRDFRHWSRPEPAFLADRRDDLGTLGRLERVRSLLNVPNNPNVMRTEFYGAGVYLAESCTIGFPWVFTISANVPVPGNQEGPIDVQVALTRDRETWSRPFRTPIIPLGKPGEWDSGMILTASQAIDVGDEVWLYYGGHNHTHGLVADYTLRDKGQQKYIGASGLAMWKKDRFGSADGPAEGATLTTIPLRFSGTRLEINASTKPQGEVRVELLDAAGQPLSGFGISEPIAGDNLRHPVVIPGQNDLALLAGRSITLRFHLRDASLFAFAFRSGAKP